MKKTARFKRKRQIARVIYFWRGDDGIAMSQIAFWLGMQPSNHIMRMLHEMECDGAIKSTRRRWRSNATRLTWRLTADGEAAILELERLYGGGTYALPND